MSIIDRIRRATVFAQTMELEPRCLELNSSDHDDLINEAKRVTYALRDGGAFKVKQYNGLPVIEVEGRMSHLAMHRRSCDPIETRRRMAI
ncbi:MAG: hypothetical protein ACYDD1_09720 [Caulobacteraceae bacterium]